MKAATREIYLQLFEHYPRLKCCAVDLEESLNQMILMYRQGGKLLVCGNGGSAADAQHIVGELMKEFHIKRPLLSQTKRYLGLGGKHTQYIMKNLQETLPAISLVGESALMTAVSNDQTAEMLFAQQVYGYGNSQDILMAITTSGNSRNIIYAAETAKIKNMKVIALTGIGGKEIMEIADITINVPETETYKIQELHLPVYHMLCRAIEEEFFGGS